MCMNKSLGTPLIAISSTNGAYAILIYANIKNYELKNFNEIITEKYYSYDVVHRMWWILINKAKCLCVCMRVGMVSNFYLKYFAFLSEQLFEGKQKP